MAALVKRVAALEGKERVGCGFSIWRTDDDINAYHEDGRVAPIAEIPDPGLSVIIRTFAEAWRSDDADADLGGEA